MLKRLDGSLTLVHCKSPPLQRSIVRWRGRAPPEAVWPMADAPTRRVMHAAAAFDLPLRTSGMREDHLSLNAHPMQRKMLHRKASRAVHGRVMFRRSLSPN
jgi:hypothetical protein